MWDIEHAIRTLSRFDFIAQFLVHQTRRKRGRDLVEGYQVRYSRRHGWRIDLAGRPLYFPRDVEGVFHLARRSPLNYFVREAESLRLDVLGLPTPTVVANPSAKPIVLKQVGRRWQVWLDPVTARLFGAKGRNLRAYGDALVPIAQVPDGSLRLEPDARSAALLSKEEADSVAHRLGRYLLGLGDLVWTYVEEQPQARRSRGDLQA